jgi:predicted N-formylglutamate amidohydrolase
VNASATAVVFSCEHGGNDVPSQFAELFRTQRAQQLLRGHHGYDIGALELARRLAAAFDVPLLAATETRLLVDMNRAATNPRVFSAFSRRLGLSARRTLIDELHTPYRASIADAVRSALASHEHVYHVAVHSFTSNWRGAERLADVGLLYDPSRSRERSFCACWRDELRNAWPSLRVRRNFPYRGTTDGLPTSLRRVFSATMYSGIELEINQRLLRNDSADLSRVLAHSLAQCLDGPLATDRA